jgi:DNA 3'-phosphatase
MYPLNPRFKKCVMDITKKFSIPEKDVWKLISAKPLHSSFHEPEEVEPGLFRIKPVEDVISDYVAAFDMDHTLSYAQSKLFPSDPDDIFVLPRRREVLEGLIKKGYKLLLFTNQFSRGKKQVNNKVNRVATFLRKLDLPMTAYIATKKDHNRKPGNGMWEYFISHNMPVKKAIFCGDALGRPGDFSDSDKMFGVNSGMKVLTPEESFPGVLVRLSQHPKRAIIFVGAPGVGKSTVYKNSFPDFVHINQDNLGTRSKVLRAIKQNIGKNMVIDSTNASQKKRQEIYDLLPDDYDMQVLYFVNDGRRGNALRTGKAHVPDIAYHLYFKHLTPPEKSEFGVHSGDVHVINGRTVKIEIVKNTPIDVTKSRKKLRKPKPKSKKKSELTPKQIKIIKDSVESFILPAGTILYRTQNPKQVGTYPIDDRDTGKTGIYLANSRHIPFGMILEYKKPLKLNVYKTTKDIKLYVGKYSFRSLEPELFYKNFKKWQQRKNHMADPVNKAYWNHFDNEAWPIDDNVFSPSNIEIFENYLINGVQMGEIFITDPKDIEFIKSEGVVTVKAAKKWLMDELRNKK